MATVSIASAARSLGVSVRTVQRWLEHGAPCEGSRGRRRVDVNQLEQWRQSAALRVFASATVWAWGGDAGHGLPLWRELALPEAEFIASQLLVYQHVAEALGQDSRFPPALRQLESRLLALRQRDRIANR